MVYTIQCTHVAAIYKQVISDSLNDIAIISQSCLLKGIYFEVGFADEYVLLMPCCIIDYRKRDAGDAVEKILKYMRSFNVRDRGIFRYADFIFRSPIFR